MALFIPQTGRFIALALLAALLAACTASRPPSAYLPSRNGIATGQTVTVEGGQNVYALAQKHNVSMRELIVLNDLKPPYTLHPGQSIILPATGESFSGSLKPPVAAPRDYVEKSDLAPITPAPVAKESLSPPPVATEPPRQIAPTTVPLSQPATQPQSSLKPPDGGPVHALNQPSPAQKQVATTTTASQAAANVVDTAIEMKWPVQGTILSNFGSKGAGLNNDGVNIGAPKGAPVVAASTGTVVYAGNEMKGFGNLVLIRHQNDWVTAYAHLDRVLVKKDSIVTKGDMIGTVGKTGNVSSPQLHFETRQNGKPVDPASVIKQ